MTKALKNYFFPLGERQGGKKGMSFFAAVLCIVKACMHLICISKNIFWPNVKFIHEPHCQAIATHAFQGSCVALTVNRIIWRFLPLTIKQTGPLTSAEAGNGRVRFNWMILMGPFQPEMLYDSIIHYFSTNTMLDFVVHLSQRYLQCAYSHCDH